MATDLDGLIMIPVTGKRATRYQHMFGQNPMWAKHLRLFGKAGTVKVATCMSPKLADHDAQCMMVGYAEKHDGDVYRMWNLVTCQVHITHDVIWLKQMMLQQFVAEDHASLSPEVEIKIETPALIQEEEQDEGTAATQLREAEKSCWRQKMMKMLRNQQFFRPLSKHSG